MYEENMFLFLVAMLVSALTFKYIKDKFFHSDDSYFNVIWNAGADYYLESPFFSLAMLHNILGLIVISAIIKMFVEIELISGLGGIIVSFSIQVVYCFFGWLKTKNIIK